jgi:biotin operon repressor
MTKLSNTDFIVWNYINSYSKNDKPFFGSNEYLSEKLHKSKSVISHSISRLLKAGNIVNKGHKYYRKLYAVSSNNVAVFNIVSAENSISNAKNDFSNAEISNSNAKNSISYEDIERAIAEISNCEMLKITISNAKNDFSNAKNDYILIKILIKILLSYTNKAEAKNNLDISLKEKINKKEKKSSVNSKADIQKEFDLIFDETIKTLPTLQKENWEGFIEMRKSIKKPLTMIAVKQLKNKLIDLAKQKNDPNDVLSNSILNSYQGVFEVKEKKEVKVIRPWWEEFEPNYTGWHRFILKQTMPENISAEQKRKIENWIERAKVENEMVLEREESLRKMREEEEEEKRLRKEEPEVFLELAKQRAREKTIKMLGRDLTTEYDEKEIMNNINKLIKGEAR